MSKYNADLGGVLLKEVELPHNTILPSFPETYIFPSEAS